MAEAPIKESEGIDVLSMTHRDIATQFGKVDFQQKLPLPEPTFTRRSSVQPEVPDVIPNV